MSEPTLLNGKFNFKRMPDGSLDKNRVICTYCRSEFSYHRSTSSLKYHLLAKHTAVAAHSNSSPTHQTSKGGRRAQLRWPEITGLQSVISYLGVTSHYFDCEWELRSHSMCVCVCVCACARAREREREMQWIVCVCVCVCVREVVNCVCVCVCVCEREREREMQLIYTCVDNQL